MTPALPPTPSASPTALPRWRAIDVACRRGHRLLFDGLTLDLHAGELLWLRGENGRGKTSLLRLAAGLSAPERGELQFQGRPVRRPADLGRALVFVGHANALKEDLTAGEALQFLLRIHGRRCDAAVVQGALERLGLTGRRDAMVRTLSQGQRRRVALARLAAEVQEASPSLWLLDEPFDALDADGVERVNALLAEHLRRGGSVLLTSHLALSPALRAREVDLDRLAAGSPAR